MTRPAFFWRPLHPIDPAHLPAYLAVRLWLAVMILTGLAALLEWGHFPLLATCGVLGQFTASMLALRLGWPARRIIVLIIVAGVLTWAAEFIGINTGLPFGEYHYTDALQPQIGHVPVIIPLAWLMMLPPAWATVERIVGRPQTGWQWLRFALLSGLAFTAWDLYLDPQMVGLNLWVWADSTGGYFGIPWINFLGWIGTSALLTLIMRPPALSTDRLYWIYRLTWIFQFGGLAVIWEQPFPALCGFIAMGIFVGLAWSSSTR